MSTVRGSLDPQAIRPGEYRRLRYAGNFPWVAFLLVVAGLGLVLGLALALAAGAGWLPLAWAPRAARLGLLLLVVAGFAGLCALVAWLLPPRAWGLLWDRAPKSVVGAGLDLARWWPSTARAIFPPVIDLTRTAWLPGLKGVRFVNGALILEVMLPPVAVPGGRKAFLESSAAEFSAVGGVYRAVFLSVSRGVARFEIIPSDATREVRAHGKK